MLRQHQAVERHRIGERGLGADAVEALAALGDVDEAALAAVGRGLHLVDHPRRQVVGQGAQALLAFPHLPLRAAAAR
jgi:hypothetical protein